MFRYNCRHTRDMMVCTARGRLTFDTLRALAVDCLTETPAAKVLYDLTHATAADLSAGELEEIIQLIGQYLGRHRGGKAAIVAHSGVDYGLARMFGTFAEIADLPVKVKVFRIPEVAKEWLAGDTQ